MKGSFDSSASRSSGLWHLQRGTFSGIRGGTSVGVPAHGGRVLWRRKTPFETARHRVFKLKGCVACHTTDGSELVGPTWKGLFGSQVTVLAEGKEVTLTADEDYLARSIHHPPKEVVKGFAPQMPKADLSERDVADLVAYIKSLH